MLSREELLERYKKQNPKKYQQKFVDPLVPAPLIITPSRLQSEAEINEIERQAKEKQEAEIQKRVDAEVERRLEQITKPNEDNTGVSTKHKANSKNVQDNA
jgi:hypothetical protein